MSTRKG